MKKKTFLWLFSLFSNIHKITKKWDKIKFFFAIFWRLNTHHGCRGVLVFSFFHLFIINLIWWAVQAFRDFRQFFLIRFLQSISNWIYGSIVANFNIFAASSTTFCVDFGSFRFFEYFLGLTKGIMNPIQLNIYAKWSRKNFIKFYCSENPLQVLEIRNSVIIKFSTTIKPTIVNENFYKIKHNSTL